MLRRRERPPVLAELPRRGRGPARAGSLSRAEMEVLGGLLKTLAPARAVLVTGRGDGEDGKCEVAIGVAAVAAAAGTRTALLECDLAVPTLAGRVGLSPTPGLHEYLTSAADAADVLQPLALAGPGSAQASEPLVCIVAGAATAEGPTLLGSEAFRRAVAKLSGAYDLLVLDGPPFESDYALREVAGAVDATVACVRQPVPASRLPVPVAGLVLRR